jgi:hypothetical protein
VRDVARLQPCMLPFVAVYRGLRGAGVVEVAVCVERDMVGVVCCCDSGRGSRLANGAT